MESKTFKILSIDGGGIKGLYSASILARIEKKTGKRISDYFDMICGTSTGGLIALGLANGMSAQSLSDLYFDKGSQIFPTSDNIFIRIVQSKWQFVKQLFFCNKHSIKPLKLILENIFGNKTMNQANNLLCIPSFNLTTGQPRVFKNSHINNGFFVDKDIKMVDVALATSSAPTYFPIHEHNEFLYADGGVWANNPSMCGLLEALDYYVGEGKEYDSYQLLSISSIAQPSGWTSTSKKAKSILHWREKVFQTALDGQSYFAHFFLLKIVNKINPKGTYFRIPPPELSLSQMGLISMDRADKKALKTIRTLGDHIGNTYAMKSEILDFFKTKKIYKK